MIEALKSKELYSMETGLFRRFIDFVGRNEAGTRSQLYQDLFVAFVLGGKFEKSFLEFGATDGVSLSNSYWLECSKGWSGLLCEPSPQWHDRLKANRPNTKIITDCIWTESGAELDFIVADQGEFSTLADFKEADQQSMSGNSEIRKHGYLTKVKTISLNDIMEQYFEGLAPAYMSVDTEGSEFEILSHFNFDRYRPKVLTVEHNFTEAEEKITRLLGQHSYTRVFKELTAFDAWYVENEVLQPLLSNQQP